MYHSGCAVQYVGYMMDFAGYWSKCMLNWTEIRSAGLATWVNVKNSICLVCFCDQFYFNLAVFVICSLFNLEQAAALLLLF